MRRQSRPKQGNKSEKEGVSNDKKALLQTQSSFVESDISEKESPDRQTEKAVQRQEAGEPVKAVRGILKGKGQTGQDANKNGGARFAAAVLTESDLPERPKFRTFSPLPSSGDESESDETKRKAAKVDTASKKKKRAQSEFNPDIYKFKKSDYNFTQEHFMQQFYLHNKANRSQINKRLVEQTYCQVLKRFEKEKKKGDFPLEFEQNEMKWAAQLMRSKKLQGIMADYREKVAQVLESELATNRQLVRDWVAYPHSHNVSPARDRLQLGQLTEPIWYPEKEHVPKQLKTAFTKQRQHLNELNKKNRQRKEAELAKSVKATENVVARVRITEQVLARMATARMKKQPQFGKAKVTAPMTPFQEAIHERLQIAQQKITEVDELDDRFQEELEEVEADLQKTAQQKAGKNPGNALRHMLQKWSDEPVFSQEDLDAHRNELWLSLEEFEKFLREQETALELENKNLKIQYRTRVDGIRAQTSMRIEALESALIECKLRMARDRERAEMTVAEMESRLLNQHLDAQSGAQMERVKDLEATMADPQFQDLPDERKVYLLERGIKRLMGTVRALQQEKTLFTKEINEFKGKIEQDAEFVSSAQDTARESSQLVLYYQQAFYEIIEQTGLLNDLDNPSSILSEDKRLALKEIFELNKERIRQDREQDKTFAQPDEKKKLKRLEKFVKEFHDVVLEVDFRNLFTIYQQVVHSKEQTIDKIVTDFGKLGLIQSDQIGLKKHQSADGATKAAAAIRVMPLEKESSQGPSSPSRQDSPVSPGRRGSKVAEKAPKALTEAEKCQTHIFRVDGEKLAQIQSNFFSLGKPVVEGVTEMIVKQENSQTAWSDFDKKSDQKGALGLDQCSVESRSKNKNGKQKENFTDKLKQKQAKRQEVQEKREKKERIAEQRKARGAKNQGLKKVGDKKGVSSIQRPSNMEHLKVVTGRPGSRHSSNSKHNDNLLKLKETEGHHSEDSDPQSIELVSSSDEDSDSSSASDSIRKSKRSKVGSAFASARHLSPSRNQRSENTNSNQILSSSKKQHIESAHLKRKNNSKSPTTGQGKQQSARESHKDSTAQGSRFSHRAQAKKQAGSKRVVSRHPTGLSVNIHGAKHEQVDQNSDNSTLQKDDDTEPLDRTREVLDELEQKVLNKYAKELRAVEEAGDAAFKLRAGTNRELSHFYKESLGTRLTAEDDTKFTMTGNLPEYIRLINATQEKYLITSTQTLIPKLQLKRKLTSSIDCDRPIPLSDCIKTEINDEGELKRFTIRPELAKILMWREEGQDFSQLKTILSTVSYLNRLMFKPDEDDYVLGTRKAPPAKVSAARAVTPPSPNQASDLLDNSENGDPMAGTSELQKLLDLLKRHSAAITAKGNPAKQRYQMRIQKDQTWDELLQYQLPHVFESLDERDRQDSSQLNTSHLTFLHYLEILLEGLSQKLESVLPAENKENLSVQQLVFYGSGGDAKPIHVPPPKKSTRSQHAQTTQDLSLMTPKRMPESKYSRKNLNAPKPKNQHCQTDEVLLEDILKEKNAQMGIRIATQKIEQTVGAEMHRTIDVLNEFVNKVQLQEQLYKGDNSKKKQGSHSFFDQASQSMATQISSSSPLSHKDAPYMQHAQHTSPTDQLKDIRAKVQTSNDMIQDEIDRFNAKKEKQMLLRTAEFSRRFEPKNNQQMRAVNLNNALGSVGGSKLPRLSKAENVRSERNYSSIGNCEVSKMPLLHNSTAQPSTLISQPFKQTRTEKKEYLNQNSTKSKFNVQKNKQRSTSQIQRQNVPGFVAKKLDFTTTPTGVKESEPLQINNLESKEDTRENTTELKEKRALSTHKIKNGQAFISIETSSVEDVNQMDNSVTPSATTELVFNKRIAGIRPHQNAQPMWLPSQVQTAGKSIMSTPQSSMRQPYTSRDEGRGKLGTRNSNYQQYRKQILVGSLENDDKDFPRKTSTTMVMMPKNQLTSPHQYETMTQHMD